MSGLEQFKDMDFEVEDSTLQLLKRNTKIVLVVDEFEDFKTIKFTKCGFGLENSKVFEADQYFKLYEVEKSVSLNYLGFSFVNHNGFAYIDIVSMNKEITLVKDDYFVILFEDGHREKYTFSKKSNSTKYKSSNIIELTSNDLMIFLTKNILKVKVVSKRKNLFSIFTLNKTANRSEVLLKYQYENSRDGQLLLRYMTYKFIAFNLSSKLKLNN